MQCLAFLGVQPIVMSLSSNALSLALIPPTDLGFYEPTVVLAFNQGHHSEAAGTQPLSGLGSNPHF